LRTGKAINDTFHTSVAQTGATSGPCTDGVAEITLPSTGLGEFDYVVTMEDLTHGQRFGNYSIDYQVSARAMSCAWSAFACAQGKV
jgi:hypothetical protein